MLDALDAGAVRAWAGAALASLEAHRAEIDRLNVFPVHDSDTGTNLVTTLRAGLDALDAFGAATPAAALQALADGAVLGASGNSGNIVAQMLRAIADAAGRSGSCDAVTLREGLQSAAVEARAAVADPVEGTILTVAAAAAAAVPEGTTTAAAVAGLALAAADEALGRTPEQLPELARAGVVDAGAQGYVLLLEALVHTIGGDAPAITPVPTGAPLAHRHSEGGGAFEVQYLLDPDADAPPDCAERLRAALARLGDSAVVVSTGGDGATTLSAHVHTDDAGAAVEAGLGLGRPYRISVSPLTQPAPPAQSKPSAVVAVAADPALAELFAREGVEVVTHDGSAETTVQAVLATVRATGTQDAVLLPNDAELGVVAEAAAERLRGSGCRVVVVPTRSPVQGLAAVAVHDAGRRFDDDVVAMAEAAAATRFAEVTVAEAESLTAVGICQPGDVLGLIDGEVVDIGSEMAEVALAVTDRLLGVGAELMTVLCGAAAPSALGEAVRSHVRERTPLTEVSVYDVGQARPPLIIGVE